MMCASFRTIMFRQIAGRSVTGADTARSYPAMHGGGVGSAGARRYSGWPSGVGDAEHLVEACGAQPGGGRPVPKFGEWIRVVVMHAAGSIQSCGIEHRRAASHLLGEQIAAGIGSAAHRRLGRG